MKLSLSTALVKLALLTVLAVVPIALLDICVLEQIIKPMAHQMGKTENDFVVTHFGITTLIWHFYYIPCSLTLLAATGYGVSRWRGVITGPLLFACGFEDWMYYWLQGQSSVPLYLPWLNQQPGVSWTRYIFHDADVSRSGMVLATGIGLLLTLMLLGKKSPE